MVDPSTISKEDLHKVLFINLVNMLASSAMQQLGKLVNPVTQKTEVNLDGARVTIDMIDMIKEKTTGNLDEDEARLLSDLLSSLQMNYVETAKSQPAEGSEETTEDSGEESDDSGNGESAETIEGSDEKPESKDPKYHKSYGEKADSVTD